MAAAVAEGIDGADEKAASGTAEDSGRCAARTTAKTISRKSARTPQAAGTAGATAERIAAREFKATLNQVENKNSWFSSYCLSRIFVADVLKPLAKRFVNKDSRLLFLVFS